MTFIQALVFQYRSAKLCDVQVENDMTVKKSGINERAQKMNDTRYSPLIGSLRRLFLSIQLKRFFFILMLLVSFNAKSIAVDDGKRGSQQGDTRITASTLLSQSFFFFFI